MKIIHSADWQIGKVFRRFGAREATLQQARRDAIDTIGRLALAEGAAHVLVAGDIYDSDAPSRVTLLEPLVRMRAFPGITWHLLPGNHDPHRPQGVWDRLRAEGLPETIVPHLAPEPFMLGSDAVLLPAPLTRRHEDRDTTAWMDDALSAPGLIRIGLAHGAVTGFGTEGEANNRIDPARPDRAGLAYLALGDWHRTMRIGPRLWYSGTPEPDRPGSQPQGKALVIDIAGPGALPDVREVVTGTYTWRDEAAMVAAQADLADLDARLRALPDPSRTVLRLALSGAVSLAVRGAVAPLAEALEASFFHVETDLAGLVTRPSEADLEAIDFDGVLRRAADDLKRRADDPVATDTARDTARDALTKLYLMVRAQGAMDLVAAKPVANARADGASGLSTRADGASGEAA